jgi:hypothetical protein
VRAVRAYTDGMITIETIADAIAAAREAALPGRECVMVSDTLWYLHRAALLRRSRFMARPQTADNVVAITNPRPNDRTTSLELELALLARFRPAAVARGTTAPRIIRDLLQTIADDQLVEAILDTQTEPPAD